MVYLVGKAKPKSTRAGKVFMTPAELLETQSTLLLSQYRALLRELRESADRAELTPAARGLLAHVECEGGLPYWIAG